MSHARFNFDPSTHQTLGILHSNEMVIDRSESHVHLRREHLEAALFLIDSQDRDYFVEQVDCGEVVGYSSCVATDSTDSIVYAHRRKRDGPTRFVLDREPEPTTNATLILKRHEFRPGLMVLISAWAGYKSQPEPWDKQLSDETSKAASDAFWVSHALIWDPSEVDFRRPFGTAEEMTQCLE